MGRKGSCKRFTRSGRATTKLGPIWKSVLAGFAAAAVVQIGLAANPAMAFGADIASVVGAAGVFAGLVAYFFFRSRP